MICGDYIVLIVENNPHNLIMGMKWGLERIFYYIK